MTKLLKHIHLLLFTLSFGLIWGGISIQASQEKPTMDTGIQADIPAEEYASTDEITVQGLEGMTIHEIKDIIPSKARSSCGINHTWEIVSTIQEASCDKEGVYKVQCTVCGATGTVSTDAPGHNFVNGVCTVCGEKQNPDNGTDEELTKWEYELDDSNGTITLTKYISDATDIIVHGTYKVNHKLYSTRIEDSSIFPLNITSIVIKEKVYFKYLGGLFMHCTDLVSADLSGIYAPDAKSISHMFYGCRSLKTLNISNLDTSNIEEMMDTFVWCSSLEELDVSHFNTSKVTAMNNLFNGCSSLKTLDVSNFDTSNVSGMAYMFSGCSSLTELDVSHFNTSKVSTMNDMFSGLNLEKLNLSNFDTSNVYTMSGMFRNCTKLKNLSFKNFDTAKVKYMDCMFSNCKNLPIDVSHFNTSKVYSMERMFEECNMSNINLKNFDTSNAGNMCYMFYNCKNLTSLDLTSFDTSKVKYMYCMFWGTTNLKQIYVNKNKWNTTNADIKNMFRDCGTQNVTFL